MPVIQVALYGKGGIGKSTVSANLSAALAESKKRVLQIGCDPKHDSTRLLLGGKSIPTVLDYIRQTPTEEQKLEALLFRGYGDTACVETGGPKPGIGCAGRGILSGFETLARLGIREIPFDVILYDVLGDVVCGGFAVPLRKEYADLVFLVTSGEYMALYAANNILRGISNFEDSTPRVAGIILNRRGLLDEEERVRAFARAVELPIVASVPRSEDFSKAEKAGRTLIETAPDSDITEIFRKLASYLKELEENRDLLHHAKPLEDPELEALVLGCKTGGKAEYFRAAKDENVKNGLSNQILTRKIPEKNFPEKSRAVKAPEEPEPPAPCLKTPLYGCAFSGAVTAIFQLSEAVTVMHGPRSCAHIISNALTSSYLRNGIIQQASSSGPSCLPSLLPTDMKEEDIIFGGLEKLREKVEEALASGRKIVFIVSTCPAGIIGDDIKQAASELETRHPEARIIPIPVDGNLAGDFSAGLFEGCKALIGLIDPEEKPENGLVNIIGERSISPRDEENFHVVEKLLKNLGCRIHCRFPNRADLTSLCSFKKAGLTLLAHTDPETKRLQAYLNERFGLEFFEHPFPVGFRESERWVKALGKHLSGSGTWVDPQSLLKEEAEKYRAGLDKYVPLLANKRVLLVSYGQDLEWVLDTIQDLQMEIVKIGVPPSAFRRIEGYGTLSREFPVDENYTDEKRNLDIKALKPDLVLSNYASLIPAEGVHYDTFPFAPKVGFQSGLELARRWSTLLRLPVVEGWKLDGVEE